MRDRIAGQLARQGISTCEDPTPGDLALRLDKNVVQRPHLEQIDKVFGRMLSGEVDRVVLSTPPQVGKSSRTIWAAFWWLAHHPKHSVVAASYGQGLADKIGAGVRALVEEYGAQFGLILDPRTTAANNWRLTTGGGMRSVGIGAGLTGHPADVAIVDDPHKDRLEAESKAIRDGVHDWWSSTLISRLAPKAPVVVILTRWHLDDLAGRLLKEEGRIETGGRWATVELPALAVGHSEDTEGTQTCPCPPEAVHDALGRSVGEPLPHPKIPLADKAAALAHWEDKRRSSTIRDWHALYQANPVPTEGALVDVDLLRAQRFYDEVSPAQRIGVAVDPSGGGRDNCGIVGGHLGADGRLWLTHDRSAVMSSYNWGRAVCQLAYDIGATVIIFENNFGKDMAGTIISASWDALVREGEIKGLKPQIKEVRAFTGKTLRAEPVAQAFKEDRVRLGKPLPNLEASWATFQEGQSRSPGELDASVYLVTELLPDAGSRATIAIPHGKRADAPAATSVLAKTKVSRPRASDSYDPRASYIRHLQVVRDEAAG